MTTLGITKNSHFVIASVRELILNERSEYENQSTAAL
jgi:hypothetical protein